MERGGKGGGGFIENFGGKGGGGKGGGGGGGRGGGGEGEGACTTPLDPALLVPGTIIALAIQGVIVLIGSRVGEQS